jgi:Bacterial type II and III secretion system protein/Bacterial type II/III secretion system short domain
MTKTLAGAVLLGLCFFLPASNLPAQQQVLEVITLGYRQADEILPILRPLLAPGGTLTGMNNRLVVKTTPANLAELKQVLATIDARPRQLMISVRQSRTASASTDSASISGTVGVGDNAQVRLPRAPGTGNDPNVTVESGRTRVQGSAINSRSARDDGVTQTVQVMDGSSAFIRVGQSAPVSSTRVTRTPGGTQVTQSTGFVDADTGFYVTPRVSGDRVTLEISTSRDRMRGSNTGAVNVQRVDTVVSGRLGEWIEIGGSAETAERTQSQTLTRSRDARSDDRRVSLKVDEVR